MSNSYREYGLGNTMQSQAGLAGPVGNKQAQRPPEIQVASATLNDKVGALMKDLAALELRLETVMRAPSPTPAANVATPSYGASTQIGQLIAQATGNVDVAINRVRDLVERLEV